MTSRALPCSNVVMLLSRLIAAASRSGHSERLTNWNWASAISSSSPFCDGPAFLFPVDCGREDSADKGGSVGPTDSLNSCNLAATLRPIPPPALGPFSRMWMMDDEELVEDEESESVLWGTTEGGVVA